MSNQQGDTVFCSPQSVKVGQLCMRVAVSLTSFSSSCRHVLTSHTNEKGGRDVTLHLCRQNVVTNNLRATTVRTLFVSQTCTNQHHVIGSTN